MSEKSAESARSGKLLPLPVGVSEYRLASKSYYYVDKTLLIRDILDERAKVSLFTRPRRFGKTLNMDMLRVFFEKTEENTAAYFRDKAIWACGEEYREHQGKYPVIFLTLKDVKCETWEDTYDALLMLLGQEIGRHEELLDSERLSTSERDCLARFLAGDVRKNDGMGALQELSRMLAKHHGAAPVIIIDEYDTPIQQGYFQGFYDEVIAFMRGLFSRGLKDNPYLTFGFLTGILRVAKESLFSGLNNLKINSLLDQRYSGYFGFTPAEVREMAAYYQVPEKYGEICTWYDGYQFGQTEIFNPWSVVNYFGNDCYPKPFWVSTSSNDVIRELLAVSDKRIAGDLKDLLQGEVVQSRIDTNVIYPQIQSDPSSIYSFLLMAGYLKPVGERMLIGGSEFYSLAIPNLEVAGVYRTEVLGQLKQMIPQRTATDVQLAIYRSDGEALRQALRELLLESASYYDTAGESFYHGLLLGLCAAMEGYRVTSNRESGEGRYDICLRPLRPALPGVLIELKAGKEKSQTELKEMAQAALQQIQERQYDTELRGQGVQTIFHYGAAFCGKAVEVASAQI